jgi:hypothetical protein
LRSNGTAAGVPVVRIEEPFAAGAAMHLVEVAGKK